MNNDEIRRDFIKYFEKLHDGHVFPKKYFGCVMAVLMEEQPVTQERIEQLTGYSRTTISQMLKMIQVSCPLQQIKIPRKRKKYYKINLPVRDFMITFLEMIVDTYRDRVDFMLPLIEEIKPYSEKHQKFRQFIQFLEKYHEMSNLYIKLFTDTADDFSCMLKTGQINAPGFTDPDLSDPQENLKLMKDLLKPPEMSPPFIQQQKMDEQLSNIYAGFKSKYYQKILENLTSAGSQVNMARTIIGTELLLEQRPLTQEEIEKTTNFQRSIISNTLRKLLDMKMIHVHKKPGDRKKYYVMIQSWDIRMIGKLRVNMKYASQAKQKISTLIEMIDAKNTDGDTVSLLIFFNHIHHIYEQYERYFKLLEAKFIGIRIKEYKKTGKTS